MLLPTHVPMSVGIPALDHIVPLVQGMLLQVTSINAETGNGAVYTQSNEAGFGGRQNLSAGVHQKKADSEAHESEAHDSEAHEFDSVYADEAALPSFAQMAAAQGPQLAGGPQLWSDKQPRLQSRGRVNDCSLLSDRCALSLHSVIEYNDRQRVM